MHVAANPMPLFIATAGDPFAGDRATRRRFREKEKQSPENASRAFHLARDSPPICSKSAYPYRAREQGRTHVNRQTRMHAKHIHTYAEKINKISVDIAGYPVTLLLKESFTSK